MKKMWKEEHLATVLITAILTTVFIICFSGTIEAMANGDYGEGNDIYNVFYQKIADQMAKDIMLRGETPLTISIGEYSQELHLVPKEEISPEIQSLINYYPYENNN